MLVSFGPWLPAAVLACALPALVVIVYGSYRQHQWRSRATPPSAGSAIMTGC